jgi:uncharacterized RDD family membrane protein YckC
MAQSCSQCGSICRDDLKTCAFCDSPLTGEPFGPHPEMPPKLAPLSSRPALRINSADEPEWRQEMARKLDAYRKRRRGGPAPMNGAMGADSQPALPFVHSPRAHAADVEGTTRRQLPVPSQARLERKPRAAREERDERVEISVSQPSLDFASTGERLHSGARLASAASTAERIQSGLIDLFFLVVVYGGFLLFFRSLGGRMDLTRTDAGIFAASFFLLYASYFSLFMIFGGATPGMLFTGLTVVQIDGAMPGTSALAWRSAGYVLSCGTACLGFLWAVWDEEHLTWHDRISQTYITSASAHDAANPFANAFPDDDQDLFHSPGSRHGYAEK